MADFIVLSIRSKIIITFCQQIASELNAAILKSENQEYTNPKLCSLLRMILWSQNELDKHNIKFPKMTDLANATIEQPK